MKRRIWLLSALFFLLVCTALFATFYDAAKRNAVSQLHEVQATHARQAAQGIEEFFSGWEGVLGSLARIESIVDLDEDGKKYMAFFQESHREQIRAITRVSAEGLLLHTVPLNPQAVGSDISGQDHVREIMRTHQPVVSEVFRAVQGYDAVALHVPVFKDSRYAGSIAIVVNFQILARRNFATIAAGTNGIAWVVSRNGTTIYSADPGQAGKSLPELYRKSPSVLGAVERMLRGKRGTAVFTIGEERGGARTAVRNYAVYMPIRLGTTHWSILVASPENQVLSSLVAYRNRLALIMSLLVIGGSLFTFLGAKAWLIIREEEKRRRVEEALRASEERFRDLADSLPQTVFETDIGGRVRYMNRAGLESFGWGAGDLAGGADILELFVPEDRPRALENRNKRFTGTNAPQEYRALRRDGSTFPVIVHAAPILRAAAPVGLRGIVIDITERKRTESALAVSEERFRTIIEHANAGILVAETASRRLLYANPEICRMLGRAPEELLTLGMEGIHPPESLPEAVAAIERMGRGEQTDAQLPCRRKDGSIFHANIRGTPLTFDGRLCLAGFFTDISDRWLLEEERLKSAKLQAIGVLAGGVAHDFNNLLQGIFGSISLAKEGLEPGHPSLSMLEQAEKALCQSVGLTTQLLTFSKGGKPLKHPLVLRPVIETAVRFSLSGSRTGCQLKIDEDLFAVDADEGQIAQVLQNIVLNADQAMPGGGRVDVVARNVRAPGAGLPAQLPPGNYVEVAVRDSGVGIPAENLPRIFDPYFTTKEKGTGLGLATSYSIIRNHGGAITVQSEPGRGSRVSFFLPATTAKAEDRPPPPGPLPRSRKARILVMDDEEIVCNVTAAMLRLLGHEVVTTAHGEEAIARFRQWRESGEPFDVVLLDLTIRGGIGGEETLRELLAIDPDVKAVVVSGYADGSVLAEHRSRGFKACLRKPYQLQALNSTLESLLA